MRALIFGPDGQVGRAIIKYAPIGWDLFPVSRREVDLSHLQKISDTIKTIMPDLIINAAAYTAVDNAETDEDIATIINGIAVGVISQAAKEVGSYFIHISTDYIFDGTSRKPYTPYDKPCPINAYGRSKLLGEKSVVGSGLVVRTSWVYSCHGQNFLNTILRLLNEKSSIRVVNDQIGAPTSSEDLAKAVWELEAYRSIGILHYTNSGFTNRFEFASLIRDFGCQFGLVPKSSILLPISSAEYTTKAARPMYSILDTKETDALIGKSRDWKAALESVIKEVSKNA